MCDHLVSVLPAFTQRSLIRDALCVVLFTAFSISNGLITTEAGIFEVYFTEYLGRK